MPNPIKPTKSKQSAAAAPTTKTKSIPQKCQRCAMLGATEAKALHGADGDGCWNPAVCYSRRSYARHRDRHNIARSQKRRQQLELLPVEMEAVSTQVFAVLLVYRPPGADTPVHAIGAQIWSGQQQCAIIPPVHCCGMTPSQVHGYVGKMLAALDSSYGIKKFASQQRLDNQLCPLTPCPHKPVVK